MTNYPNLIKKIDDFARLADAFRMLRKAAAEPESPDEELQGPGLYSEILKTAADVFEKSPDVSTELVLMAMLYKQAVLQNGGFAYVKKAIKNAYSAIVDSVGDSGDEEEDEEGGELTVLDQAETILDKISAEMTEKSKSPNQMNPAEAETQLKAVKSGFNTNEAAGIIDNQKQTYEKGSQENASGYNTGPGALETPQKYALEILRLKDGLQNDPSISLNVAPSEKSINQNIRNNMEALIDVITRLVKQLPLVLELEGKVKDAPDDAATKEAFIKAATELSNLRQQRRDLRKSINKYLMSKDMEELEAKFVKARTPKEKKWIEEKIKLQRVRLSNDYKKKPEIKARKALINATGTVDDDNFFIPLDPSPEMMQRLQDAIAAGAAQKVNKVQYDAEQSKRRAKTHGQIGDIVPRRKGRRGGGSPRARINQYDIGAATFHGLVDKLGEKINTATHVSRLAVTQVKEQGKAKTHNALKPYVDALSKAIQKKDNQAKYTAIKALKEQLTEWSSKEPAIKALEKNVRLLPFFKKYESELDLIAKWKKEGEGWNLDEAQKSYIRQVLASWDKLLNIYGRYYQGKGAPKGVSQLDLNFNNAITYIGAVLNRLEYETGVYAEREEPEEQLRVDQPGPQVRVSPDDAEEEPTEETGPQKRMQTLTQLLGK